MKIFNAISRGFCSEYNMGHLSASWFFGNRINLPSLRSKTTVFLTFDCIVEPMMMDSLFLESLPNGIIYIRTFVNPYRSRGISVWVGSVILWPSEVLIWLRLKVIENMIENILQGEQIYYDHNTNIVFSPLMTLTNETPVPMPDLMTITKLIINVSPIISIRLCQQLTHSPHNALQTQLIEKISY